jgi:microcystin-dependent protein
VGIESSIEVKGSVTSGEGFFQMVQVGSDKIKINVAAVPAGAVMAFACGTEPEGWLECNGRCLHKTVYAALYAAIGDSFISHSNSINMQDDQFAIPDLRGWFVRGWDRRAQAGARALGNRQDDALQKHIHDFEAGQQVTSLFSPDYSNATHKMTLFTEAPSNHAMSVDAVFSTGGSTPAFRGKESLVSTAGLSHDHQYTPTGTITEPSNPGARLADETRPRNICLMYCIKC